MKKSLLANILLSIICISSIADFEKNMQTRAAYQRAMNPGMQIRLEQATIEGLKKAMVRFLPRFVEYDMKLPHDLVWKFDAFGMGLLDWNFRWTNIEYMKPQLDVMDTEIKFVNDDIWGPAVKIDFPLIESWEIKAHQQLNTWILPSQSDVEFYLIDFQLKINSGLVLDENGYLDLEVLKSQFLIGDSYLHHDNFILELFMHQTIYYVMVIVENSSFWAGKYVFTHLLGPVVDSMLNHYRMELELQHPVIGQSTLDRFVFDYRNTHSPNLQNGFGDFYFLGELMHNNHECHIESDPMDFMNSKTFSQLVISESAASCIANSMANSNLGRTILDRDKINKAFKTKGLLFDSTSMKQFLPIFEDRLGRNVPLTLDIDMKDIKVLFGQFDSNIILEYKLNYRFYAKSRKDHSLLIQDRLTMLTSMNLKADNDVMFINVLNHKIVHNEKFGPKDLPTKNNMNMSKQDYKEFLAQFGFWMNHIKKWLNTDILPKGLLFPYGVDEFKSQVYFKEKSMHITLEVEEEASKYFEDNYWEKPVE